MEQKQDRSWVSVEFYVQSKVICGYIYISSELRLLDLLNKAGTQDRDVESEYIEFMTAVSPVGDDYKDVRYVRKAAVELATIADANLARGAGAAAHRNSHPFVDKVQVRVSLQLPVYALDGTMHCTPGLSVRDVLDEKSLFLPLTDVTIALEGRLHETRPFVAAKKEHIIWLKESDPSDMSFPG